MNAARDLAATGTQTPWRVDYTRYGVQYADGIVIDPDTDGVLLAADTSKIVRAVNALGPLGDYDDAVMAYLKHQTGCHVPSWCPDLARLWRELTTTRERLMAALTGDAT